MTAVGSARGRGLGEPFAAELARLLSRALDTAERSAAHNLDR
jgi:hypothetical protein